MNIDLLKFKPELTEKQRTLLLDLVSQVNDFHINEIILSTHKVSELFGYSICLEENEFEKLIENLIEFSGITVESSFERNGKKMTNYANLVDSFENNTDYVKIRFGNGIIFLLHRYFISH